MNRPTRIDVRSVVQDEDQICCYRSITSTGLRALWEIVRACNLKCDFCLVPDGGRGRPIEETLRTARELIAAGVHKVLLSGGEPLLYKPIDQIIDAFVDAGVLVKLLTNGTVHRPAIFDRIDRHKEIELSISLQSVREEVSDGIFGAKGTHARIMALFERVASSRIHVNVVCGKLNIGEIPMLLDWAEERRVGSVTLINVFQNPRVAGRFQEDCRIHELSEAERASLLAMVARRRRAGPGLVIRTLNFASASGCETCAAGRSIVYVDAEGHILPCTLTDNTAYEAQTRGMTVGEALDHFRVAVPPLPASSCSGPLRRSWEAAGNRDAVAAG